MIKYIHFLRNCSCVFWKRILEIRPRKADTCLQEINGRGFLITLYVGKIDIFIYPYKHFQYFYNPRAPNIDSLLPLLPDDEYGLKNLCFQKFMEHEHYYKMYKDFYM